MSLDPFWPIKPLAKRTVADLGDFAGITWFHLAAVAIAISIASDLVYEDGWALGVSLVLVPVFVGNLFLVRSQPKVVEGPNADSTLAPYLAVGLFWLGVVAALTSSFPESLDPFGVAFYWAFIAWGREDDDNGQTVLARAFDSAKSAVRGFRTSPVRP